MTYDLFVSYAHADNDDGWIDTFIKNLSSTYRKLTGEPPKVFLDRESLITSSVWEAKIKRSLGESNLMLAVLSPAYVRSPWCRKEWELFTLREEAMRKEAALPAEQGIIFPILLYPLDRGRFNTDQLSFLTIARTRQWLDVSSQLEGTPIRQTQIRELAESLIDVDAETKSRRRAVLTTLAPATHEVTSTILDSNSRLEWSAELSPTELTFAAASKYVKGLPAGKGGLWRLPTKKELEGLVDPDALDPDPKATPFPLRPPFNAQRFGYLHSSTYIDSTNKPYGNYIMNVRNGHIFNGKGYKCYVRAVREYTE